MAGENYHHGPEVIRVEDETGVVVDQKMAVTWLQGTAPIQDVHATAPARVPFVNQPVIIRSWEQAVAAFGEPKAGYSIPQALRSIFNKNEGQGCGTIIVNNVFDPDIHKTGAVPDPALVSTADHVGAVAVDGKRSGFEVAMVCYNRFGFFPRRIIAPGATGVLGIRQKMLEIANRVKGHAIWDMTSGLTIQQAIEARGTTQPFATASGRAVICYPRLKALDAITGDQSLQPYSQHFAGIWNRVIATQGPQHSPSNVAMNDVSGTEVDVVWAPNDYSVDTNLLNEAGIVTTMTRYGQGIHTWGASSTLWPTVHNTEAWLHAQVVMDAIDDAVLFFTIPYTDRGAVIRRLSIIEERVNAYLASKSGADDLNAWLYGGNFRFDRTKTTAESVVGQGQLFWKLDRQPIGIMHRITIEASTKLEYVDQALGLAA
ncbi:phage tail sheath subtilisin-like domain-containing protein [Bosea sp. (in: a-proteobacteria)]|jgi:hypothetical protein|uniref:phage tail sheath subtilisin-like domain-containing protein n=1 Tax=Bosea sp. (in: a-proteobacteria) TaxID=1871050 RepID=UPI003569A8AB